MRFRALSVIVFICLIIPGFGMADSVTQFSAWLPSDLYASETMSTDNGDLSPGFALGTWDNYSGPSVEHAASVFTGGDVWVLGGKQAASYYKDIWVYDTTTEEWHKNGFMPTRRAQHASEIVNGKIYVLGGMDTYSSNVSDVDIYDLTANTWTTLSASKEIKFARSEVIGQYIYIHEGGASGGSTGGGIDSNGGAGGGSANFTRFDTQSQQWQAVASMPKAMTQPSLTTDGTYLYVAGGRINYQTTDYDIYRYDPSSNSWTNLTQRPVPTAGVAIEHHGGQLLLRGGENETNSPMNRVDAYTISTGQWSTLNDMPHALVKYNSVNDGSGTYYLTQARQGYQFRSGVYTHTVSSDSWDVTGAMPHNPQYFEAAKVGAGIWIIGGELPDSAGGGNPDSGIGGSYNGGNGGGVSGVVKAFNPSTKTWADLPDLKTDRSWHTSAVHGSTVYVFGGQHNSSTFFNSVESRTTGQWAYESSMPAARSKMAAATLGDRIYVAGGWDGAVMDRLDIYDPINDTWSSGQPMREARSELCVEAYDGYIWAIGGKNSSSTSRSVERYDPATNTWTYETPMQSFVQGAACDVADDRLWVIGGLSGYFPTNWVQYYDGTSWSRGTDQPGVRGYHEAVAFDETQIYTFGGRSASGMAYSDAMYRLDIAPRGWMISAPQSMSSMLLDSVELTATLPVGATGCIQLRTNDTSGGLSGQFLGPDGSSNTCYNIIDGTTNLTAWSGHDDHDWLQYRVFLEGPDRANLPALHDLALYWNSRPLFIFTGPTPQTYFDDMLTVTWTDQDIDDVATISLELDTDDVDGGEWTLAQLSESATGSGSYDWDTTTTPTGTYWLKATIDDGRAQSVDRLGPITIIHNTTNEFLEVATDLVPHGRDHFFRTRHTDTTQAAAGIDEAFLQFDTQAHGPVVIRWDAAQGVQEIHDPYDVIAGSGTGTVLGAVTEVDWSIELNLGNWVEGTIPVRTNSSNLAGGLAEAWTTSNTDLGLTLTVVNLTAVDLDAPFDGSPTLEEFDLVRPGDDLRFTGDVVFVGSTITPADDVYDVVVGGITDPGTAGFFDITYTVAHQTEPGLHLYISLQGLPSGISYDPTGAEWNLTVDQTLPELLSFSPAQGATLPQSANQVITAEIADEDFLLSSLILHYWIEADHDQNGDGLADGSEYTQAPFTGAGPIYSSSIDDSNNLAGQRVSLWIEGHDATDNWIPGGSGGFENDLSTYYSGIDMPVAISAVRIDGAPANGVHLAPGVTHTLDVDMNDANGWGDLDTVQIVFDQGDAEITWYRSNGSIETVGMQHANLTTPRVGDSIFTLSADFTLDWGLDPGLHTLLVHALDHQEYEASSTPAPWTYDSEIVLGTTTLTTDGQPVWAVIGSGVPLQLDAQVHFYLSSEVPENDITVVQLINGMTSAGAYEDGIATGVTETLPLGTISIQLEVHAPGNQTILTPEFVLQVDDSPPELVALSPAWISSGAETIDLVAEIAEDRSLVQADFVWSLQRQGVPSEGGMQSAQLVTSASGNEEMFTTLTVPPVETGDLLTVELVVRDEGGNALGMTPALIPVIYTGPDLAVLNLTAPETTTRGEVEMVQLTILNVGMETATKAHLWLLMNDEVLSEISLDDIEAGEEVELEIEYDAIEVGTFEITVEVEALGEDDGEDNIAVFTIEVQSPEASEIAGALKATLWTVGILAALGLLALLGVLFVRKMQDGAFTETWDDFMESPTFAQTQLGDYTRYDQAWNEGAQAEGSGWYENGAGWNEFDETYYGHYSQQGYEQSWSDQ